MKECQKQECRRCFSDGVESCPADGCPTLATLPGDPNIDRYLLERRLGQGGMGIVYKAQHKYLHTIHALKIIIPGPLALDQNIAARFRQEALAMAAIKHLNVIGITDSGIAEGGMPFLVMEFLQGKSLDDLLARDGPLPPSIALEILSAVGAGVAAVHARGIIHRDLKPQNIFIQDGLPFSQAVKVLDFGLVKVLSPDILGSLKLDKSTGVAGTPFYAAPEQWLYEEPDERTDVYALGLILYQMLAGRLPFSGTNISEMARMHLEAAPPPISSFGVSIPPQLEAAVNHALAKDRGMRPPSVKDFLDELSTEHEMLAQTLRIEPPTPTPEQLTAHSTDAEPHTTLAKRLFGLLRTRAGGTALALFTAVLALFVLFYKSDLLISRVKRPPPINQPIPTANDWRLKHVLGKHTSSVDAVAFSPSGDTIATGSFDATVRFWDAETGLPRSRPIPRVGASYAKFLFAMVFIPGLDRLALAMDNNVLVWDTRGRGGEATRLAEHRDKVFALAASPDGKLLASGSGDGSIIIWDTAAWNRLHTLTRSAQVKSVAFSPDSLTLASTGYDKVVTLWDAQTGELKKELGGHTSPVFAVAFSPDNETIASAGEDGVILLWDARGSTTPRTLKRHGGPVNALAFSPDGRTLASGSDDKTTILWDVSTGEAQVLKHHVAEVNAVAFSPDGRLLATGSRDRTAALWETIGSAPAR